MTQAAAADSCARCGGQLAHLPGSQRLQCRQCGSETGLGARTPPAADWMPLEDLRARLPAEAPDPAGQTVICPSCGAANTLLPTLVIAPCEHCGSSLACDDGPLPPVAVVPFQITESEARTRLRRFLGRLSAPAAFSAFLTGRQARLVAVYLPFLRLRGSVAGRYQISYLSDEKHVELSGELHTTLSDIAVLAADLPGRSGALARWDFSALVDWDPGYAAGLHAERISVGLDHLETAIGEQVSSAALRQACRNCAVHSASLDVFQPTLQDLWVQPVLLPAWLATVHAGRQRFGLAVNGQTGAVGGEKPHRRWPTTLAIFLAIAILAFFMTKAYPG